LCFASGSPIPPALYGNRRCVLPTTPSALRSAEMTIYHSASISISLVFVYFPASGFHVEQDSPGVPRPRSSDELTQCSASPPFGMHSSFRHRYSHVTIMFARLMHLAKNIWPSSRFFRSVYVRPPNRCSTEQAPPLNLLLLCWMLRWLCVCLEYCYVSDMEAFDRPHPFDR